MRMRYDHCLTSVLLPSPPPSQLLVVECLPRPPRPPPPLPPPSPPTVPSPLPLPGGSLPRAATPLRPRHHRLGAASPTPLQPHLYGLSNFVPVSLGPHLYILGGSHFDARTYPLDIPTASATAHRLDLTTPPSLLTWHRLPTASTTTPVLGGDDSGGGIIIAGGGSYHSMFPSEGSRMISVEWYDVYSAEWKMGEGLPRYRAGCMGFLVQWGDEEEFWLMGGYGDYRMVSGVVPADVYYRDTMVVGMRSGKWREVGEMWEEGERRKFGSVVAVGGEDRQRQGFSCSIKMIF